MADDKNKQNSDPLSSKSNSSTMTLDNTKDFNKSDANPADAYQNHQNVDLKDVEVKVNYNDAVQAALQSIKRQNMDAKQNEIDAPGTLTQDEANKLKEGLDPAKQEEVQAQVVNFSGDNLGRRTERMNRISGLISEIMSDNSLGRNETRAQLRIVRQQIQEIEMQMDLNKI